MSFLYANVGWANGFDVHGHLLRENLLATNCIDYAIARAGECQANWKHSNSKASAARTPDLGRLGRLLALTAKAERKRARGAGRTKPLDEPTRTGPRPAGGGGEGASGGRGRGALPAGSAKEILKYLLGQ
jgi:hypothetical protein